MSGKAEIALPCLGQWRVYKLMSVGELASKSGLSAVLVASIEKGHKTTFTSLAKLSDALGVERQMLLASPPVPPKSR